MKKALLMISLIAVSLSACVKKEEVPKVVNSTNPVNIISSFTYPASNFVNVKVVEFKNAFNQECISVHANYEYDSSKASVHCIVADKINYPTRDYKIVEQLSYDTINTPVQVTSLITKHNNQCTIVHANYEYQDSIATVSCN